MAVAGPVSGLWPLVCVVCVVYVVYVKTRGNWPGLGLVAVGFCGGAVYVKKRGNWPSPGLVAVGFCRGAVSVKKPGQLAVPGARGRPLPWRRGLCEKNGGICRPRGSWPSVSVAARFL